MTANYLYGDCDHLSILSPGVRKTALWCQRKMDLRSVDFTRMLRTMEPEPQIERDGFFLSMAWDALPPSLSEAYLLYLYDGTLHVSIAEGTEGRVTLVDMGFLTFSGKIPTEIREYFYPKARFYFEQ